MSGCLDMRGLLADLARADCECVVIGSSALVLQGWDVDPSDLDLFTVPSGVDRIKETIGALNGETTPIIDGKAQRIECGTDRGSVDLYLEVSGGLTYNTVRAEALKIHVGDDDLVVAVGSLEHVRDMRSAVGRSGLPQEAVAPAAKPGALSVIAIDGPAGAGKSTVSRAAAQRLGFTYLNTGAMYRCVTLAILERRADPDDLAAIAKIANEARIEFRDEHVLLDGRDVSEDIRRGDVTTATPYFAAFPEVREALVRRQRLLFASGNYVAEGRDTGTVVAPEAPLKIFLTASLEERAKRRALEVDDEASAVQQDLESRDRLDSERRLSALCVAEDAVVIDTTGRSIRDVVDEIACLSRERGIA